MQFKKKKIMLVLLSCSAILAACGGGSGSDEATPDAANNDGVQEPISQIDIQPLMQETCDAILEYEWVSNNCQMIKNPQVTNLAVIESLETSERNDLLTWLTNIEKGVDLNSVFPNSPASEFDDKEDDKEIKFYLDTSALAVLSNGKSVIESDDQTVIFSKFTSPSGFSSHERTRQVTINDNQIVDINYKLERSGAEMILTVRGKEIYRTLLADSMSLSTHIGNPDVTTTDIEANFSKTYFASEDKEFASLDGELFIEAALESTQANQNSIDFITEKLSLTDKTRDKILVEQPSALNYRVILNNEESSYFSTSFPQVYLENTIFLNSLNDSENASFQIESTYKALDFVALGLLAPKVIFSATNTINFSSRVIDSVAGSTGEPVIEVDTYQILPSTINRYVFDSNANLDVFISRLFEEYELRQHALLNAEYSKDLTTLDRQAFPDITESLTVFTGWLGTPKTLEMFLTRGDLNSLLTRGIPSYTTSPSPEELSAMLAWPDDLKLAIQASLRNIDDVSLATYTQRLQLWQTQSGDAKFYSGMLEEMIYLMQDLDVQQLILYTPKFIDLITSYAYRKVLVGLQEGAQVSLYIKNAIAAAEIDFSKPVPQLITNIAKLNYDTTTNEWWFPDNSLDQLKIIPLLLSESNKEKMIQHDNLAKNYKIDFMAENYLDHEVDDLPEFVDRKIQSLKAIESFLIEDKNLVIDEDDFQPGSEKLAKHAYESHWNGEILNDLTIVMQFSFPSTVLGFACLEGSTTEKFLCQSNYSSENIKRLSTVAGEGYLATVNGIKPYVVNSQKLIEAHQIIASINEFQNLTLDALDDTYLDQIKSGLWLTCSAEQITAQSSKVLDILDQYLVLVQENPNPTVFSDEYERQSNLRENFENTLVSCTP
ncbi:MAG: hypothetical protein AAGB12_07075 [Pseudomonadota bacterium]